jgi:site-specific DNA-methyltransferase (adenine-specific)
VTGFTSLYWAYASGFPKAVNISRAIDKRHGAERKTIGHYRVPDIRGGRYGSASRTLLRAIPGGPVTREAKELNGAYGGFQPKPAVEVVLVAMKPLDEQTYMRQALANGKGVTWLADCRVPYGSKDNTPRRAGNGRFPANLVVSDRVLDYWSDGNEQPADSVSRYFDLDHWFETRSRELPPSVRATLPVLIVSKASRRDRDRGLRPGQNVHPTVKPVQLMTYLVTLGSRTGDVVLDPFAGSGTTCLAARLLGRRYLGIEREPAYVRLAWARASVRPEAG